MRNRFIKLPDWFDELKDVIGINVECIDDNIIEVHLRFNPNPIDKYKELIVCWKDSGYYKKTYANHGYEYIESYISIIFYICFNDLLMFFDVFLAFVFKCFCCLLLK